MAASGVEREGSRGGAETRRPEWKPWGPWARSVGRRDVPASSPLLRWGRGLRCAALSHILADFLIRLGLYPVLYWLGFVVLKTATLGKANVSCFSELGQEEDLAWNQMRVRWQGHSFWLPESSILIGGVTVLVGISVYALWCFL